MNLKYTEGSFIFIFQQLMQCKYKLFLEVWNEKLGMWSEVEVMGGEGLKMGSKTYLIISKN